MHAVRIHAFGGPEALSYDRIDKPEPGENEVVVAVRAAGVNPVDYKIRNGGYPAVTDKDLPVVLGRELAGVVVRTGANAADLKRGDEVVAHIGFDRGAYAEEVVVRSGEWAIKPEALDWETAGSLPLAGDTAWQGLFDHGDLKPGGRVLIHGGSGGVGHLAVQFAKLRGAFVYATAGTRHVQAVKDLGADVVIDYETARFEDEATDLDLVYDLQGGETRARSWALLKPGGRLVNTTHDGDVEAEGRAHDRTGITYSASPRGADLDRMVRHVAEGRVRVLVDRSFPLKAAADAHRALEHDHPVGKIVLTT